NGLRGILRFSESPAGQNPTPVKDGLRFADRPPMTHEILVSLFGQEHVVYNLLGLIQTFRSVGRMMGHYAHQVGFEEYLKTYAETLNGKDRFRLPAERAELQRKLIDTAAREYGEWVMQYARANGWNVRFRGLDKIPEKGRVVYALAPHSAIYP